MKIKELGHTAENLIEQGEQTQREINMRQSELARARNDVREAQLMLDAMKDEDSEGRKPGGSYSAHAALQAALVRLEEVQEELKISEKSLQRINIEKRSVIDAAEKYNETERRNLKKLEILKNKRFGGNVNAFVADLIERMNQGENIQEILYKSLGEQYSNEAFNSIGKESNGSFSIQKDDNVAELEEEARRLISQTVRKSNISHDVIYDGLPGNSRACLLYTSRCV